MHCFDLCCFAALCNCHHQLACGSCCVAVAIAYCMGPAISERGAAMLVYSRAHGRCNLGFVLAMQCTGRHIHICRLSVTVVAMHICCTLSHSACAVLGILLTCMCTHAVIGVQLQLQDLPHVTLLRPHATLHSWHAIVYYVFCTLQLCKVTKGHGPA